MPTPRPIDPNRPQLRQLTPQPVLKSKKPSVMLAISAALVLAAGGLFWGTNSPVGHGADGMSKQKADQITAQFATAVADFPIANVHDPVEKAKAEKALQLPPAETKKIMQAAEKGEVRLAWVTVWDNEAEDGDVVRISSEGYSVQVALLNRPTTVIIPAPAGGKFAITGVRDGGGGITVGVKTVSGEIPFPPMAPGQTLTLPIK